MLVDALVAVNIRNHFYRQGQRRAVVILLASILTNIVLIYTLVYLILNPPAPKYFPVRVNGHILQMMPLDRPNQSDEAIARWAAQAAVASFSYSYVNYRGELQASSEFFTGEGWGQFLGALQSSNNLDAVTAKHMVVSAQVVNMPKIVRKDLVNGEFSWCIEVPILVTYQNDTEYTQQYNMVTISIRRVSILNAPKGVGIGQLVVSPITDGSSS